MATNGAHNGASLTRLAAQRLRKISSTDPSAALKNKAALAILDYLSSVAAGLQGPWAPAMCKYARSRKGAPEAYAWGLGNDISVETAALVNATLAHSAIRDDMHLKSNSHIGGMVISAAFAMAQRENWSGAQLVKGIIGGYEMAALLGVAVQQSPGYNRHVRPSGIIGAFGAAGAAIAANEVSEDIATNALGLAANMASGFNEWAWAGGPEIYTEMGFASQSGIVAYDLAAAGMTCSETLLEGRAGCFAALGASDGEPLFRKGLSGETGQGLDAVRFKPVPGCNYAQTPLATALKVAKAHNLSAGIERIDVRATSGAKNYPGCDNHGPFEAIQQTKMSIQFGVSAVLLHADVSEEIFAKWNDQQITELASRCDVTSLPDFDKSFSEGRQPARVEVKLCDGTTVSEELPDVPWLEANAVQSRFDTELSLLISSSEARKRLRELVDGLVGLKTCDEVFGIFKQATALQI